MSNKYQLILNNVAKLNPQLILFDYDKVEMANMNRMFYQRVHCGLYKVDAAASTLKVIDPDVKIIPVTSNITKVEDFNGFMEILK